MKLRGRVDKYAGRVYFEQNLEIGKWSGLTGPSHFIIKMITNNI